MDIKKDKTVTAWPGQKKPMLVAGVLLLAGLALYGMTGRTVAVKRDQVVISTIRSGTLNVTVEGFGSLRSEKLSRVTATSNATVKEILMKPGALVKEGDVIAVLVNPEVQQLYESAQNGLGKANANYQQGLVNNRLQILNERANLAEAELSHNLAKHKSEALAPLADQGAVTKFQYLDIKAEERRQKARLEFLREKLVTLQNVHQQMDKIQRGLVAQQEGELQLAKGKLDQLTIRAESAGILQKLSIEGGQSVPSGQEISVVGSVDTLVGYIKVPQNKVERIKLGDKAIIDNNQDRVEGRVARIEPVVVDNMVAVEISLPAQLPATFKPQQNVDARIVVRAVADSLYFERPAKSAENKEIQLYRVNADNQGGELVTLGLGDFADSYIEVKKGARAGDRFIISDLSNLLSTEKQIEIK